MWKTLGQWKIKIWPTTKNISAPIICTWFTLQNLRWRHAKCIYTLQQLGWKIMFSSLRSHDLNFHKQEWSTHSEDKITSSQLCLEVLWTMQHLWSTIKHTEQPSIFIDFFFLKKEPWTGIPPSLWVPCENTWLHLML